MAPISKLRPAGDGACALPAIAYTNLEMAGALLRWDQTTYMPPGGAATRGRQLSTLGRLSHEKFIEPDVGRLLDALRSNEESLPFDSDDASLIRVTRREYERAIKVPPEFVARLTEHATASYQAWTVARPGVLGPSHVGNIDCGQIIRSPLEN